MKVVDLTFNIAGPYATLILADLGADVLKIERPGPGDDSRRMAPTYGEGSAYYFAINRNKRSVALDIQSEDDAARLMDLLAKADVFVTNLRPDTLRKHRLDYDSLHSRIPRLIYADISGYGVGGPQENRPGYDMVLQARSGLLSVTGDHGRPPVRIGVSILDMGAGQWLAMGVLAALSVRDRVGGQRVSTSLLEVGVAFMTYDLAAYSLTGDLPEPRGSEHPAFSPYGMYRAEDGYLALGVGADHIFSRLALVLDRAEWLEQPEYRSNEARVANRGAFRRELEAVLMKNSVRHWVDILDASGVPAEAVADVEKIRDDDQLSAIDAWLQVPIFSTSSGEERVLELPGLPIRLDGVRPPVRLGPPTRPGDDNDEVFSSDAEAGGGQWPLRNPRGEGAH